MIDFFFDTADTDYIRKTWDVLGNHADNFTFGITTNPNAMNKVNCNTVDKFVARTNELLDLLEELGQSDGLVYVQFPSTQMSDDECLKFVDLITKLQRWSNMGIDGPRIALKIPHFSRMLKLSSKVYFSSLSVNVTGISDCGTIMKASLCPNVRYASIIPGRMEEVGIDANAHLKFLAMTNLNGTEVITGSMRTIEGLKSAVYYNTVPTIGWRVWDKIAEQDIWSEFPTYWENRFDPAECILEDDYIPNITETNRQLSVDFFEQMDDMGNDLYLDFIKEG